MLRGPTVIALDVPWSSAAAGAKGVTQMDVIEPIRKRYSVRKYLDEPVPEETLLRIMEAARLAPSASNTQEWRFVLVSDPAKREALCKAAQGQPFVREAPIVIVACAQTDQRVMSCGQCAYTIDVAIALEHIALQAAAEDLGTCWVGAFSEDEARKVIGAPDDVRIVQLMTLGVPAMGSRAKNRKELSEIVMYEQWGGSKPG